MIGMKFSKPLDLDTMNLYTEAAEWCNGNGALIVERGPEEAFPQGFYEVMTSDARRAEELAAMTEEERAELTLAEAKTKRAEAVAALTVEVDGMVFDGDEKAQERMARTVTAATSTGEGMDAVTTWVLHNNTVAQVTVRQLAVALRLAGEEQTRLWTIPYEASYTTVEAA